MKHRKKFSVIVLYNEYGEIFIQDRRSISKIGEEWGLFGGGVEENETFEEALIREVKEELNLDITGTYKFIGNIKNSIEGLGEQTSHLYLLKYDGDLHKDLKVLEGDGGKFVTLEEFSLLKIAPWTHFTIELIKRYFIENLIELKLELPKQSDKIKYEEVLKQWKESENIPTSPGKFFSGENFEDFLSIINNDIDNNTNGVNSHLYFLKKGDDILGSLQVRHTIDHPNLIENGGHIGYGIAPKHRKKGYASHMLKLGIKKAKKLGLDKVLITCDIDNIGSIKVIEKNGGIFERLSKDGTKKRYWIDLKEKTSFYLLF